MKRLTLLLFLALAGCAVQTGGGEGGSPPERCAGSGELSAEDACTTVVAFVESYGCTFAGTCNASCPAGEVVCRASVRDCESEALAYIEGSPASLRAEACQNAIAYCNVALACEP